MNKKMTIKQLKDPFQQEELDNISLRATGNVHIDFDLGFYLDELLEYSTSDDDKVETLVKRYLFDTIHINLKDLKLSKVRVEGQEI